MGPEPGDVTLSPRTVDAVAADMGVPPLSSGRDVRIGGRGGGASLPVPSERRKADTTITKAIRNRAGRHVPPSVERTAPRWGVQDQASSLAGSGTL